MKRFLVWLGLSEPAPVPSTSTVSVTIRPEIDEFTREMRRTAVSWTTPRRRAFDEAVAAFDRPVSTEAILARYLEQVAS